MRDYAELDSVVWLFRTREGSVRLHVGVAAESKNDLYIELRSCAVIADTYAEFLSLATRAATSHEAVIADVFRQPWPTRSLIAEMRSLASEPRLSKVISQVLDLATAANRTEVAELLEDQGNSSVRLFIRDVISSLDQDAPAFTHDLAAALRISEDRLVEALDRDGEPPIPS